MAILDLVVEITTVLDNNKASVSVFPDLIKALDTINHDVLLKKLQHCAIGGIAAKWINSYLGNRQQYVQLDAIIFEQQSINCGIPQGSILGPKLFIIYMNDLRNVSNVLKFNLFADDTTIFYSDNDINTLGKIVSVELEKLYT